MNGRDRKRATAKQSREILIATFWGHPLDTKFTKQEQSSASSAFGCTWKLSAQIPKSTNKNHHESQNTKKINQNQPKPTTTAITFCQG